MRPYCEFDTECDHHWWLIKFYLPDGRMFEYDISAESAQPLAYASVQWFINNYTLVSFNGDNYDIPMLSLAMAGADVFELKRANDHIIKGGLKRWEFRDAYPRATPLQNLDHVDIMEVAPGVRIGLKTYMGRMHAQMLQDLPFDPEKPMPLHMRPVTAEYCGNDLLGTRQLREEVADRLALRIEVGEAYGVDLRSKSDAQMAEAIIKSEVMRLRREAAEQFQVPELPQLDEWGRIRPPMPRARQWVPPIEKRVVPHGYQFQYEPPAWMQFSTPVMQQAFDLARKAWFVVNDKDQLIDDPTFHTKDGKKIKTGVQLPAELKALKIAHDGSVYQFGMGGLHSTESSVAHHSVIGVQTISDHDVKSYYPSLILSLGMYPTQLGRVFLDIYRGIYDSRLGAKAAIAALEAAAAAEPQNAHIAAKLVKAITKAGGEKIVLNGTFGKLFSKYSIMFAPELGIRVTLTGQLSLLMLIESLSLCGIRTVSANTDGIVVCTPWGREWLRDQCIKAWEQRTGLEMEATFYKSIYQRDVNAYVAIKLDGKHKGKGAYSESGVNNNVHPERDVCNDAVIAYLKKGTPLMETIRSCKDVRRFLVIRNVKGGGYDQQGRYLGGTCRWYYARGEAGALRYKDKPNPKVPGTMMQGNTVAGSTGARACQVLPKELPGDIDYDLYHAHAVKHLQALGVSHAG